MYTTTERPNQSPPNEMLQLQLGPSISEHALDLTDLKLLHHFLLYAHPHLPLGKEKAWITDVPCQASEYPHLMHAILSLSAAHLGSYDATIASSVPLVHRQKALAWLSDVLSAKEDLTDTELETATNVSMALTFQTAYMDDTFYEFMQMLRGTGTLTLAKFHRQNFRDPISTMTTPFEVSTLFQHISIDNRIQQAAIRSLLNCAHLYTVDGVLRNVYQEELEVAYALQRSSWEGYLGLWKLYTECTLQSSEISAQVLDNQNPLAKILQVHLLSFGIIATPLRLFEFGERARYHPMEAMIAWIEGICGSLNGAFSQYARWPTQICVASRDFGKHNRLSASNMAKLVLEQPELLSLPD